jgi:hypothetical protein
VLGHELDDAARCFPRCFSALPFARHYANS